MFVLVFVCLKFDSRNIRFHFQLALAAVLDLGSKALLAAAAPETQFVICCGHRRPQHLGLPAVDVALPRSSASPPTLVHPHLNRREPACWRQSFPCVKQTPHMSASLILCLVKSDVFPQLNQHSRFLD